MNKFLVNLPQLDQENETVEIRYCKNPIEEFIPLKLGDFSSKLFFSPVITGVKTKKVSINELKTVNETFEKKSLQSDFEITLRIGVAHNFLKEVIIATKESCMSIIDIRAEKITKTTYLLYITYMKDTLGEVILSPHPKYPSLTTAGITNILYVLKIRAHII